MALRQQCARQEIRVVAYAALLRGKFTGEQENVHVVPRNQLSARNLVSSDYIFSPLRSRPQ